MQSVLNYLLLASMFIALNWSARARLVIGKDRCSPKHLPQGILQVGHGGASLALLERKSDWGYAISSLSASRTQATSVPHGLAITCVPA